MTLVSDPISILNLVLCIIIVVLGCVGYKRSKDKTPLYLAIAFGLFGLSHLLTILGLRETLEACLITIRTIAYIMVAYTLFRIAFKR
jgi:uncharacterized membrane protein